MATETFFDDLFIYLIDNDMKNEIQEWLNKLLIDKEVFSLALERLLLILLEDRKYQEFEKYWLEYKDSFKERSRNALIRVMDEIEDSDYLELMAR